MDAFELATPTDHQQLAEALSKGCALKAGGIDLLDRMKEGLDRPARVVALHALLDERVELADEGGVRIGAKVTLAKLAGHQGLGKLHRALARAAADAATPQVRSQATIAGNLLQRSRCPYYRRAELPCRKKGGELCYVHGGHQQSAGVFDTALCPAVHPSNLAVPLLAAGAELELLREGELRRMPIDELFVSPAEDATREHRLAEGEVVIAVHLPPLRGWGSGYHEVRQRAAADWALCSAAAYVELEGDRVSRARVALGFVGPRPLRLPAVEQAMVGKALDLASVRAAAGLAFDRAQPLPGTRYKLPMGRACIERALLAAGGISR